MADNTNEHASKADVEAIRSDVEVLKTKLDIVSADVTGLKTDVAALKTDVAGIKTDLRALKTGIDEKFQTLEDRLVERIRDSQTELLRSFHGWARAMAQPHWIIRSH